MALDRETASKLQVLIWPMIYSGLLLAGLGAALMRNGVDWGWLLVAGGLLDAAVGVVLIWVRSRVPDPE